MQQSLSKTSSEFSRIISLAPSATEILYALGLADNIIAVTRFCDFPAEAKQKPKIGGWLDIDFDKVMQLKPDLAITSTFVQDKIVEKLKDLNVTIHHSDPKTLEQVYNTILELGKLTNTFDKSKKIIENMKNKVNELSILAKNYPKKRIYVEEWHKPPTVSGNWVPKIVELSNNISLIEEGLISREITYEEIKDFDPDFMIVSWCGFGTNVDVNIIKNRPNWNNLKIVKENKITVFDDSLLNRPGPRLVDGLEQLIKTVH